MSQVITTKTELTDLDCLKQGATALDSRIRVVAMSGKRYRNMDWLLDLTCEGVFNVHVCRDKDGTLSLLADMDYGSVQKLYGVQFSRLKQQYSLAHTRKELRGQKVRGMIRQHTATDGSIVLRVGI